MEPPSQVTLPCPVRGSCAFLTVFPTAESSATSDTFVMNTEERMRRRLCTPCRTHALLVCIMFHMPPCSAALHLSGMPTRGKSLSSPLNVRYRLVKKNVNNQVSLKCHLWGEDLERCPDNDTGGISDVVPPPSWGPVWTSWPAGSLSPWEAQVILFYLFPSTFITSKQC